MSVSTGVSGGAGSDGKKEPRRLGGVREGTSSPSYSAITQNIEDGFGEGIVEAVLKAFPDVTDAKEAIANDVFKIATENHAFPIKDNFIQEVVASSIYEFLYAKLNNMIQNSETDSNIDAYLKSLLEKFREASTYAVEATPVRNDAELERHINQKIPAELVKQVQQLRTKYNKLTDAPKRSWGSVLPGLANAVTLPVRLPYRGAKYIGGAVSSAVSSLVTGVANTLSLQNIEGADKPAASAPLLPPVPEESAAETILGAPETLDSSELILAAGLPETATSLVSETVETAQPTFPPPAAIPPLKREALDIDSTSAVTIPPLQRQTLTMHTTSREVIPPVVTATPTASAPPTVMGPKCSKVVKNAIKAVKSRVNSDVAKALDAVVAKSGIQSDIDNPRSCGTKILKDLAALTLIEMSARVSREVGFEHGYLGYLERAGKTVLLAVQDLIGEIYSKLLAERLVTKEQIAQVITGDTQYIKNQNLIAKALAGDNVSFTETNAADTIGMQVIAALKENPDRVVGLIDDVAKIQNATSTIRLNLAVIDQKTYSILELKSALPNLNKIISHIARAVNPTDEDRGVGLIHFADGGFRDPYILTSQLTYPGLTGRRSDLESIARLGTTRYQYSAKHLEDIAAGLGDRRTPNALQLLKELNAAPKRKTPKRKTPTRKSPARTRKTPTRKSPARKTSTGRRSRK